MISTRAQFLLLAVIVFVGALTIYLEPAPGPQITVVKTKQIDARKLLK